MMEALRDALTRAPSDTTVRAVMLAAEGPAYWVGADVKWLAALDDPQEEVRRLVSAHHAAILAMRVLTKLVVAAVNGAAAGGGWSFALAADYRLAAPTATFTPAYLRRGSRQTVAPRPTSPASWAWGAPRSCCATARSTRRPP